MTAEGELLVRFQTAEIGTGCSFLAGGTVLVYYDPTEDTLTAGPNRCRHQGGRFRTATDSELTCPRHGWRLDASTMTYVEPIGSLRHEEYEVRRGADGWVEVWKRATDPPWRTDRRQPQQLAQGEMSVTFWSHACAEIKCGELTIFTDPWLVGPAFTKGWWLSHHPSPEALRRLARADVVYISHNHPDHLNGPTLRALAAMAPDVRILVPAFESDSCERLVASAGLSNIVAAPFLKWIDLSDDTRICLLPDAAGRDDSGLLVDHRGHLILNTVDCANINGGDLPGDLDVLMTSFAGGASGYPVCWEELYGEAQVLAKVSQRRREVRRKSAELAAATGARVWIPFAGYFTEAHPADFDVRRLNRKNSPEEVARLVRTVSPSTVPWVPESGQTIDVSDGTLALTAAPRTDFSPEAELRQYLPDITSALTFTPLQGLEGLQAYFSWAGFTGELLLHVIETDDYFTTALREFWVDFRSGGLVSAEPPERSGARYLRMRVRADSFRCVLRDQLPWEDISIGFQARFFRDPDVYNFDFWDHMQNRLPTTPVHWP